MGCSPNNDRIVKKIEKKLNKSSGYESTLDIKVDITGNKSQYKMKEVYKKNGKTIVKITYPKKSGGISLEYVDDKVIINNPSIKQSITMKDFKDLDKGFLAKYIFKDIKKIRFVEEKKLKGKTYYIFDYLIKENNKYNHKKVIFFDKQELKPHKMEILDRDGITRTTILYQNFKFLP